MTHNIIGWTSDEKFERDLSKRIRQVILPLQRHKENQQKVKQEEQVFDHLSFAEKRDSILSQINESAKKFYYINGPEIDEYDPDIIRMRRNRQKEELLLGFISRSFTWKEINKSWYYRRVNLLERLDGVPRSSRPVYSGDKRNAILVYCTLQRISNLTIQHALTTHSKMESTEKIYIKQYSSRKETVIFIDNIKSIPELKSRLESTLF